MTLKMATRRRCEVTVTYIHPFSEVRNSNFTLVRSYYLHKENKMATDLW